MNADGQAAIKAVKDLIDSLRESVKYWQTRFDKAQEAEDVDMQRKEMPPENLLAIAFSHGVMVGMEMEKP